MKFIILRLSRIILLQLSTLKLRDILLVVCISSFFCNKDMYEMH